MAGGRKGRRTAGMEFAVRDVNTAPWDYLNDMTTPHVTMGLTVCPSCGELLTAEQRRRDVVGVNFRNAAHLVCPLPEVLGPTVDRFGKEHGERASHLLRELRRREPVRWHKAVESLFLGRDRVVAEHLEVWWQGVTE